VQKASVYAHASYWSILYSTIQQIIDKLHDTTRKRNVTRRNEKLHYKASKLIVKRNEYHQTSIGNL